MDLVKTGWPPSWLLRPDSCDELRETERSAEEAVEKKGFCGAGGGGGGATLSCSEGCATLRHMYNLQRIWITDLG